MHVKRRFFMAQVAVFLAPGFEEIEAFTVVDYLRRANVKVMTSHYYDWILKTTVFWN